MLRPARGILDDLGHDGLGQRWHETCAACRWQEARWGQRGQAGFTPPRQGLQAHEAAVGEIYLGLVERDDLTFGQGLAQSFGLAQVFPGHPVLCWGIPLQSCWLPLGLPQGQARSAKEIPAGLPGLGDRDPHERIEDDREVLDRNGREHGGPDLVSHRFRIIRRLEQRGEDGPLQASGGRLRRQRFPKSLAEQDED